MDRKEQLLTSAASFLSRQFEIRSNQSLSTISQKMVQTIEELGMVLSSVLEKASALQESGRKGSISCISFSIMRSSILLREYGFRVDVFDELFFADSAEASSEWKLDWLFQWSDEDFDAVVKDIRASMPRVQDYELLELKNAYVLNYYALAMLLLLQVLPSAIEQVKVPKIIRAPIIHISAGQYMERQQTVFEWRE